MMVRLVGCGSGNFSSSDFKGKVGRVFLEPCGNFDFSGVTKSITSLPGSTFMARVPLRMGGEGVTRLMGLGSSLRAVRITRGGVKVTSISLSDSSIFRSPSS